MSIVPTRTAADSPKSCHITDDVPSIIFSCLIPLIRHCRLSCTSSVPHDHLLLDTAPNIGPLISLWELDIFKICRSKNLRAWETLKFRHFCIRDLWTCQFPNKIWVVQDYRHCPRIGNRGVLGIPRKGSEEQHMVNATETNSSNFSSGMLYLWYPSCVSTAIWRNTAR